MTASKGVKIKFYVLGTVYFLLFVAEFCVSFRNDSVALLADAYYNIFQSSIWFLLGTQYSTSAFKSYSYGTGRKDVFGKLFVATFTAALYFSTFVEGIQTLFTKDNVPEIEYIIELLVFGGVGVALSVISCCLLGVSMECSYETGSMKKYWVVRLSTELLKMINNLSGSMLVLLCGFANMWFMGKVPKCVLDGIVAMLIVTIQSTILWSISKQNAKVLLQCTPRGFDIDHIKKQVPIEYSEVIEVHELHVWELLTDDVIVTAHLILKPELAKETSQVAVVGKKVTTFLKKFGATRIALQFEFGSKALTLTNGNNCLQACPQADKDCAERKCCIHAAPVKEKVSIEDGHDEGHGHSHTAGKSGHGHSHGGGGGHGHSHAQGHGHSHASSGG